QVPAASPTGEVRRARADLDLAPPQLAHADVRVGAREHPDHRLQAITGRAGRVVGEREVMGGVLFRATHEGLDAGVAIVLVDAEPIDLDALAGRSPAQDLGL